MKVFNIFVICGSFFTGLITKLKRQENIKISYKKLSKLYLA